jgi:predicted permease
MSDWTDSTIINALKILVRDRQHIVDIVRMVVYVGTALLLVDIYRRDRSDNRDPNWFWLTSVLGSWIVAIAGKLLLEFLEMDDTDQMRWQAIMSGVNSYCFLRSF